MKTFVASAVLALITQTSLSARADHKGPANITKDTEALADRACACKNKACADKVIDDLVDLLKHNKQAAGDESRVQKAGERIGTCAVQAGADANQMVAKMKQFDADSEALPAECNDYKAAIEQLSRCDKMPKDARVAMKEAFDQASTGWATLSANEKAGLATACKACSDAVRQSVAVCRGPSLRDVDWKARYHATTSASPGGRAELTEVVYGDLDGDGVDEAAVRLLFPDTKSQDVFVFTLRAGQPSEIGTIDGGWRSDGGLITVQIRDHAILIERSELAPGECMGCASIIQSERWLWRKGKLNEDVAARRRRAATQ